MDSPYVEILKHMQKQGSKLNPPSVQIGVMISSNVLKIGDLQLDKDNLLIADYLVSSNLKAGDAMAVILTDDRQTCIILARVVRL